MFNYKGFCIWVNSVTQQWYVQSGFEVLHTGTKSGCKRYASLHCED
ncbi:hypothetical protein NVP1083O_08 [Vibrio phage 1.083.O._10N.286.52.B9]|nr:hypothetical protein NVP1083O_08 [Vibrio phage 1.083.O._10N.286.52.B9]